MDELDFRFKYFYGYRFSDQYDIAQDNASLNDEKVRVCL